MEEGFPDDDSPEAREGRLLHEYMAHPELDHSFLKPGQRDLLEIADQLSMRVLDRIGFSPNAGKQFREKTLWLEDNVNGVIRPPLMQGTPDLRQVWDDELGTTLIIDWKFGYNIVERAELNMQLRAYAVMAPETESVYVAILQPRLRYDERISLARYDIDAIELAREEIIRIIEESEYNKKAKLVAGEEQCRRCKAKINCPAFAKMFGPLKALAFGKDFSVTLREAKLEEKLQSLDNDKLDKLLLAVACADMVKKPAHAEARRRMKSETPLTNYTLEDDYEVREIADAQRAISMLEMADLIPREQSLKLCSLPIGQIEDVVRDTFGGTKKFVKARIDRVLKDVIERIPRNGRLTRTKGGEK